MKVDGVKTENVCIDINPKQVLKEILRQSIVSFANDFKIEDGKLFEYERTGWYDSDYVYKRAATEEEIKLYDAYELMLSYIDKNNIK